MIQENLVHQRTPTDCKSLIPVKDIQDQFNFATTPEELRLALLLQLYGLKMIASGTEFEDGTDCAAWVLGPENNGHYFTFAGKGSFSKTHVYGAVAVYGYHIYEPQGLRGESTFLSHQEASEKIKAGEGEHIYYESKHIGLTTPDGEIISKWGAAPGTDYVIQHPEHIVPSLYGEVDYISLSTVVFDTQGNSHEVYVMPQYNHNAQDNYNLELILTDGKRKIASIKGMLRGKMEQRNSMFLITEFEKATVADELYLPDLFESILHFLDDSSPAITDVLLLSRSAKGISDLTKKRLISYIVSKRTADFLLKE